MLTKQEIFNKVWLGAKSQGFAQSVGVNNLCMYRSPSGLKCNAGWLIPDAKYIREFEGLCAWDLPGSFVESLGLTKNLSFVAELQNVHDDSSSPADHQYRLLDLASEYNLTIPDDTD